jgi:uncharacterized protein YjbI with pentapeptide repeats
VLPISVLASLIAFVAMAYVVLQLAPDWFAETRGLDAQGRVTARQGVRTATLALLAGGLAVLGSFYTARTFALNRAGQITDRFTKAIEQLGHMTAIDVRLGGIYALERIARDSKHDHPQVIEVLTAYIREHASRGTAAAGTSTRPDEPSTTTDTPSVYPRAALATDVQAALTVLGRRTLQHEKDSEPALNLVGAQLTKANLAEASLRHADLRGADLRGADLYGADLSGAHLHGANLSEANLVVADLSGADLRGAILRGPNLSGADLRGANLRGATLDEANLFAANLSEADLVAANLAGADLDGASLRGANLYLANLSGAELLGADLHGADLHAADLRGANLYAANLSGAKLRRANLVAAKLGAANLSLADLPGADLGGADLAVANLSRADLGAVKLDGANLREAKLAGANLHDAAYNAHTTWPLNFDASAAGANNTPAKTEPGEDTPTRTA